jgi:hypothetical protein
MRARCPLAVCGATPAIRASSMPSGATVHQDVKHRSARGISRHRRDFCKRCGTRHRADFSCGTGS